MRKQNQLKTLIQSKRPYWQPPVIHALDTIRTGDMPGDKIQINESHLDKTNKLFPALLALMEEALGDQEKLVISVHGGSGVGKSETGSLLGYYLDDMGIGNYILSGDNYPKRIPTYNDAERLRIYRSSGIRGLVDHNLFNHDVKEDLEVLWQEETDAAEDMCHDHPWLVTYQASGRQGLADYLGTDQEIDFNEINQIIQDFKNGETSIYLKRMGRQLSDLWYDAVDFSEVDVLIIEWTHGNNRNLLGVDIPILLNSTPEETLAHRLSRNRDGKTDSAFTKTVLSLEQDLLRAQAGMAKIIVTKSGELIDYDTYLKQMSKAPIRIGPMINAYPDSIGSQLSGMVEFLSHEKLAKTFESFYILPSLFNTDLDRGFSVIDYELNETLATNRDLDQLKAKGIQLKLDFILNHASVLSPQFQDILKNGQQSKYKDFFINWNDFWKGYGSMTNGILLPDEGHIKDMFFRKPGLPILSVRMPDGEEIPYWNTFYQKVSYPHLDPQDLMGHMELQYSRACLLANEVNDALAQGLSPKEISGSFTEDEKNQLVDFLETKRRYLGQMDLNIKSPLVWDFYEATLDRLATYGAEIVRLDAFAYAPKAPGRRNFLNDPETWDLLSQVNRLAQARGLRLLPEIHAKYEEGIHTRISQEGYMTYDFFLPGLIIDAFERQDAGVLKAWIQEILDQGLQTVNMLGCHDGIPLLDLKGLLNEDQIQNLIDTVVSRGGHVKDLHGKKNIYYQVNATYFSALGESEERLVLARALQMFMPGKPQIWYLDLFAGKNDYEAVKAAGPGGHKEINRSNLSLQEALDQLDVPVVMKQLALIKMRNTHPVFKSTSEITLLDTEPHILAIQWLSGPHKARLKVNFKTCQYDLEI